MKKMKRLVAILLASVMALVMLTACGEEAASRSDEQKVEEVCQTVFNALLGTDYKNDATLEAAAKKYLNESLTSYGVLASGKSMSYISEADADGNVISIQIMPENNTGKPMGMSPAQVKELTEKPDAINAKIAELKSMDGYEAYATIMKAVVKGMGTGAVKKGDKVYVAVAYKVPKAFYNKHN